ncbi:MAG: hypothetical protein HQK97_01190 [Nitrospirae bacterium]|nr:hypothetical protein [Nitrospirota bacterium]
MYYIAWVILIVIVAIWKRELRQTKAAYLAILGELKSERMEFDKLREKYAALLKAQMAKSDKPDKFDKRSPTLASRSRT